MASKIQRITVVNDTPAADEFGVVVRLVGGSGPSGDVTIIAPLPLPVTFGKAGTATTTNVVASAVNTTLLAANAARLGATLYNDADKSVFMKFGVTASSSSFTKKMLSNEYYEVPFNYTGQIDAIWLAAPTGNMRITELTT